MINKNMVENSTTPQLPTTMLPSTNETRNTDTKDNVYEAKAGREEDVFRRFTDLILSSYSEPETTINPSTQQPSTISPGAKTNNNRHLEKSIEQDIDIRPLRSDLMEDLQLDMDQTPDNSGVGSSFLTGPSQQDTTETTQPKSSSTQPIQIVTGSTEHDSNINTETASALTQTSKIESISTTPTPSAQEQSVTTTSAPESGSTGKPSEKPTKSFLQKADEFIEKNIFNFRKFLNES